MEKQKNVLMFEECETVEELDRDFTEGMVAGIGAAAAIMGIMALVMT